MDLENIVDVSASAIQLLDGGKIYFETGFGRRLASGSSEAQMERRLERNRSATPPPAADGSHARLAFSGEHERAGRK
jgi:hypothetical protein